MSLPPAQQNAQFLAESQAAKRLEMVDITVVKDIDTRQTIILFPVVSCSLLVNIKWERRIAQISDDIC